MKFEPRELGNLPLGDDVLSLLHLPPQPQTLHTYSSPESHLP
jgi:hypothetical protein